MAIAFLLYHYVISLFGKELFLQYDFFLVPGMFFIILSGTFDLIAVLVMKGYLGLNEKTVKSEKNKIHYIILSMILIFSYLFFYLLVIDDDEGFFIFQLIGAILFLFLYLKWKVIDIPTRASGLYEDGTGPRRASASAVPLTVFLISLPVLIFALSFEQAPLDTIVLVYLEVLFSASVLIDIFNIVGLLIDIKRISGNRKYTLF